LIRGNIRRLQDNKNKISGMDLVSQTADVVIEHGEQEASALHVELSRRIRAGDGGAESQLVRCVQPGLKMMLLRILDGDQALADDIVQETLLVLLKRLRGDGLEDPRGLAAFAAQTARKLTAALRRKHFRRRTDTDNEAIDQVEAPMPALETQTSDEDAAWAVRKLLSEMRNTRDRVLLKRFYLDDNDKETLCQEFAMSEAALNQALSRARLRFRAILGQRGLGKSDLLEAPQ
jgi:RNA polymerase sigma factor (sigma-70 family)